MAVVSRWLARLPDVTSNGGGFSRARWIDVECDVDPVKGVHDVYLRFAGTGTDPPLNLHYFQFE